MAAHIDVLGFLLGALVFSIGFLSNREHAQYEALAQQVRDRSWHLTGIIAQSGGPSPDELLRELVVVRPHRDRVAVLSRVVNLVLFLASTVVYVDALRLIGVLDDVPANAVLITSCVFGSAFAVITIGEYDIHRVSVDERNVLRGSLLGEVEQLRLALACGDHAQARALVARLSDKHHDWTLLGELSAAIDLSENRPDRAWDRVEPLIVTGRRLHVTAILAAAAGIELGHLPDTLVSVTRVQQHSPTRSGAALRRSVALMCAHPEAIFDALHPDDLQALSLACEEGGNGALDIRAADLAPTRAILDRLRTWHSPGTLDSVPKALDGSAFEIVLSEVADPSEDLQGARIDAVAAFGAPALESLGTVCLAQRRSRTALRLLERAVRLAPASATAHWGRAIACHQLAWVDAAHESLRRARTLGLDELLEGYTAAWIQDERTAREDELLVDAPLTDLDRLRFALVGVHVAIPVETHTPREHLFRRLLTAAHVEAAPPRALVIDGPSAEECA